MVNQYYVYIMTNYDNRVFYVGVTSNIVRRVYEHKNKLVKGFTEKYNISKLVYYEVALSPDAAIVREKQIKAGSRQKKLGLISDFNPTFTDLFEGIQ